MGHHHLDLGPRESCMSAVRFYRMIQCEDRRDLNFGAVESSQLKVQERLSKPGPSARHQNLKN